MMIIRKGTVEDAKACVEVAKLDNNTYWKEKYFVDSAGNDDAVFLVAEEGNDVRGYVLGYIVPTNRNEAMLHETRVDNRHRGKGIGARLVDDFCKEIFKKGAEIVYAEIEPELLKFYGDKCKFEKSGEWIEVARKS